MKYRLQDLIDMEHFQNLQDRLNEIYSFPSSIIDNDGNILTATAWQDICTQFHRKNKDTELLCIKSDQYIQSHLHEANPAVSYRCPHGLVDNATPIIIDGIHYGNFFTGQFFLEKPDMEFFSAQAKKYGFDEEAYLEAVKKVPIWTQDQLDSYLFFIKGLIAVISESGLKKLKEIETRKQIEKSEKRHRSILKTAMDGYWLTDTEGRLLEINDAYCEMSGYSQDELLTMHISDLEASESPQIVAKHMDILISKGSDRFESKHRRKDGTIFDIEVSVQFRPEEGGRCVCFLRDITERKRADEELQEISQRLKLAASSAKLGIWDWDLTSNKMIWDDQMLELYGLTRETFPGGIEAWQNGLHLEDRDKTIEECQAAVRGEKEWNTDFRVLHPDGTIKHIKANGIVIRDSAGTAVRMLGTNFDITERKRAEEMLRLHMAIMETVAEGIFLIGLEDNIIKWTNSKFEQLFGYGPGEMVGMHVDKVNAPTEKTPTETRLSIVDILRQTGEWHGEIKSIKKNGTHFWSYIHVSLFNHPEFGTVMVSAHTDITDRKQAEAELQESELRFRTMANAIPQLAWIARADGYIFWYNQRWYDYTGTAPEQMEGWGWQNVHDPNVLPKVLERWQASLATSEPFDMTFPLRGADGVFRPFLTRVIPLKDNAGRVMQWFGTNTDISELKRVEQALRESEALYRSIGESIDYGVWICAPDGRNTYASESFLKMVGITQEQCSNFGWGNVLHPDDAERTITAWQECVRTGGTWDIEHRFRGTDGQWHHVLARGVPVRNEQGEIISWAGINLDINRIKQAEEQLRASLAEKEVLLKEIHHRVKNNLQVISSLISLQADSLADEQMQGVLGDVRDRVRTMALVHEKLYQTEDLARLDFAEYALSLLKYIWDSHSASNGNVRLNMSLSPLILPVGTVVLCGLILNELASNAIKHAFPDGRGGEVTVTLEHDPATGAVSLRVRDNGVGLPADLDWRQTNSLGLRLVQMLAKQMRGTVETGPGPGTEFQINFNVKGIPS